MTDDLVKRLRANASWGDDRFAEAADRIAALTAERDKAYASGYSDAETEISKSALGQGNAFLHSQYANAADHIKAMTAERDRLRQTLERIASYLSEPAGEADEEDTMNSLRGDLRFVGRVTRAALNHRKRAEP